MREEGTSTVTSSEWSSTPSRGKIRQSTCPKNVQEFLVEDVRLRQKDERWFTDKDDGSNMYSEPIGLAKATARHQEAAGVSGEAKRTQGTRAALSTDLGGLNLEALKDLLPKDQVKVADRAIQDCTDAVPSGSLIVCINCYRYAGLLARMNEKITQS